VINDSLMESLAVIFISDSDLVKRYSFIMILLEPLAC
jgi:hypothetical protein